MTPEFGNLALICALILATLLAVVPLWGASTGRVLWMSASRSLAMGMFLFVFIAFCLLTYLFLDDDFSVKYVAQNSNLLLPTHFKVSAVWAGHEGSFLLWALVLCGWTLAVSIFSRELPLEVLSRVLSVLGFLTVGFLLFMILTSNPFERQLFPQVPQDGSDLNPLLQDFGLIIHPPMLYMGYVGFSVAFAFAIAALLGGRLDSAWARWSRPWTNLAWAFQTAGIALGSWWAYYELGWGGWWFWDPVENASFMPWLVGTALMHSLAVTEKRGVFKSWTILLAIFAFSLSLLGTFIVRSGVLTSVHSFAADPTRGLFILAFLGLVVGGSLLLYAIRVPEIKSAPGFTWVSRESFLLFNNILFVVATAIVLYGTLYPVIIEFITGEKISVGPPWFNLFFLPVMGVVAVIIGIGSVLNWKKTQISKIAHWFYAPIGIAVVVGLIAPLFAEPYSPTAAVAVAVGVWVLASTIASIFKSTSKSKDRGAALKKLSLSFYGMVFAHLGFGITLLGVTLTSIYEDQQDVRLEFQQKVDVGGRLFELVEVVPHKGPNYETQVGEVRVYKNDELEVTLWPEKRAYLSQRGNVMTEAGIDAGFWRDLYVSLGDELDSRAWSVRVHYKPFVRWVWLGAIFMAFGAVLTVSDKRYRARKLIMKTELRSANSNLAKTADAAV